MNILFDLSHPAHVHLFKNLYWELKRQEHNVFVTTKDIESVTELLRIYQIPYFNIGKKYGSLYGKTCMQLYYDYRIHKIVKDFDIDICMGSSINIAHVSKVTKAKSLVFDDDDSSQEFFFAKFGHPFSDYIITPKALQHENYGDKHIVYNGYHELFYLYPNRFKADESALKYIGCNKNDKFFILRLNAFKAHHDIGKSGIPDDKQNEIIGELEKYGKVFITTEGEIKEGLKPYQLKIPADKIHSILYYATMFLGDSQTMTSEAAVLGTPALKCNSFAGKLSIPNELEKKYDLCYAFQLDDIDHFMEKFHSLIKIEDIKTIWNSKKNKMLNDMCDPNSFIINRFVQGNSMHQLK